MRTWERTNKLKQRSNCLVIKNFCIKYMKIKKSCLDKTNVYQQLFLFIIIFPFKYIGTW